MRRLIYNQLTLIFAISFIAINPVDLLAIGPESGTPFYFESNVNSTRQNAITIATEKARPAIVGINVTAIEKVIARDPYMDLFSGLFGGMYYREIPQKVHSLGSGFIISPDGYILTNHHVAGNAKEIIVTLITGEKYNARIIGADRTSDVALLKIDAKNLPFLKFSDSDNLLIGEWSIAMGNPFGLFDINAKPTVTVGVVSNLDVNMMNEDNYGSESFYRIYRGMIQTDAAISSGNSGGPLLNANGDVIGMNTVIFSTSQSRDGAGSIGIGFAIPINRVKQIVDYFKFGKNINRQTYLGMEISKITPRDVKNYGLDLDEGIFITRIYRNSPAEKSDLELGDIIVAIDGTKIYRPEDYYIPVFDGKVGDKLTFDVLRNGKIIKKDVILESMKR